MAMVTVTPYPSLGVSARAARKAARAEKAAKSRVRRWGQRVLATFAIMFALLGVGGGTAHAWPWDVAENVTAFITNFCGPNDVRGLSTHVGPDTMLGLNDIPDSPKRGTILPSTFEGEGNGLSRINAAYSGQNDVIHPSYERYGFSTLQWTNYGGGCFSTGYWFTPVANGFLNVIVHGPMIAGMGLMNLVLPQDGGGNWLYDIWGALISPFTSAFTQIFTPIALFVAPFGILWVWMKNRGSVQSVAKAAVWIITIFGTMLWMGNNTSFLVEKVNTFVPTFTAGAAAKINDVTTGDSFDATNPRGETYQALWHGISYQTWLVGEVGPEQAGIDQSREKAGEVGWGPAILNGLYVGNDPEGRAVQAAANNWNSNSYAPEKDGFFSDAETKVSDWVDDEIYKQVPLLYAVGAMCNDDMGGGGDTGPEDNRWMYGGSCDSAGAETAHMVPYFQGQMYNNQMVTVFSGAVGAAAVVLAIALVSLYLGLQMMMFFFMMLFAPVFLTISLFADEKRKRFATRYFELLIANVVKQCAAVIAILFVAHSMSTLMYGTALDMPWMLKPLAAMLFLTAIVLFLFPLASIAKAAAKGDTSVVDKTYNAPKKAAAVTAKAAVAALAVGATAGAAAPLLGGATGALGSGKAASLLTTAGRALGSRGGVGKALTTAGRMTRLGNHAAASANDALGARKARAAGVAQMLSGASGKKYIENLKGKPGMVDKNGNLTLAGMKQAKKDFQKEVESGFKNKRADALQAHHMQNFFAGYRRDAGTAAAKRANVALDGNGVVMDAAAAKAAGLTLDAQGRPIEYHNLDPESPQMKQAAAAARMREQHDAARQKNMAAAAANAAPGQGKFSPETTPVDPKTGLPKDPAAAAAVKAGVDLKPDGTVADPEAAKAAGIHVDPDGKPITAAAAAAMSGTQGAASGNVSARQDDPKVAEEMARKGFAAQARDRVDGPAFAKDDNIKTTVDAKGDEVLSKAGITQADAERDPSVLLSTTAYRNGDVTSMDPKHPATAALTDLKFAMAEGSDEQSRAAAAKAANAISIHGVPNQVSGVAATGETAQKFASADVVGAMPTLNGESTWQERAEGAKTMAAAAASMPEGHSATPAVQTYVAALSNPEMGVDEVDKLKADAITALGQADQAASPEARQTVMAGVVANEVNAADPTSATSGGRVGSGAAGEGPVERSNTIAAPVRDQMSALDSKADEASKYAEGDDSEQAQAAAARAMSVSPKYNPDVAAATQAVDSLPQDHAAHGALDNFAAVAADPQSTEAQRQAALEQVQQAVETPVEAGSGTAAPSGAAFVAAPLPGMENIQPQQPQAATAAGQDAPQAQQSTDTFPKGLESFDNSVSSRAQVLGAVPMGEGEDNLGYTTTIGGQSYTAASPASLEALNHHARSIAGEANYDVAQGAFVAPEGGSAYADSVRDQRLSAVAQEQYGITPMSEGDKSLGHTANIGGQTYTAADANSLKAFQSDYANYTMGEGAQAEGAVVSDRQVEMANIGAEHRTNEAAVQDVVWQENKNYENASTSAAALGVAADPERYDPATRSFEGQAEAQQAQVEAQRAQATDAREALVATTASVGQEHYGVTPMTEDQKDLGYTANIGGQKFTAESQEALDTFSNDVDNFAIASANAASGAAPLTEGQRALAEAGDQWRGDAGHGRETSPDTGAFDHERVASTSQGEQRQPSLFENEGGQQFAADAPANDRGPAPEQPALFDMPGQPEAARADQPVSEAPAADLGGDRGDAFVAGAAGAALSGDRDGGNSYEQPALFDVPGQPAPAADRPTVETSYDGGFEAQQARYDEVVSEAAQTHGVTPMAEGQADLGYTETIGSQTYTAPSREALDALRNDVEDFRPQGDGDFDAAGAGAAGFAAGALIDRDDRNDAQSYPEAGYTGIGVDDAQRSYEPAGDLGEREFRQADEVPAAGYAGVGADDAPAPATFRADAPEQSYEQPQRDTFGAADTGADDYAPAGVAGIGSDGYDGGRRDEQPALFDMPDAADQQPTDAFRAEPAADDVAPAGYAGIGSDDDRGYDTPAQEREEYQAQVEAAGAYREERSADDFGGPSFAAEQPVDSYRDDNDGPSFAAMGPLVDRDGYGPEGASRSGGIDRDGYGDERERPDAYYNEGHDRDGYGSEGMTPEGYDQMRDRDGYGSGQPGLYDTTNSEGRYYDEHDVASATMGSEGYGDHHTVEREIIREVQADNAPQPEAPGERQPDEDFFAGPEHRNQDDMLMEGTFTSQRETPDSGGSWRDEADFGPQAEGQASFADDGDAYTAAAAAGMLRQDASDEEMRARIDREDLTEALRRAREEENYLRQADHGPAPMPADSARETPPQEPYSSGQGQQGTEPPVRPSAQPADSGQERLVDREIREGSDPSNPDNQGDDVQEYRQTRRRRRSRFFSPRDNMDDNETE